MSVLYVSPCEYAIICDCSCTASVEIKYTNNVSSVIQCSHVTAKIGFAVLS